MKAISLPVGWARTKSLAALSLHCALMTQIPVAPAAQIDFDDAPNGSVVDSRYPGVTFGCVACASGHAFARDMSAFGSTTAASGTNVVTLVAPFNAGDPNSSTLTSFNALQGAVSATFAAPQQFVSIDARPQLPLEFLGAANNRPFLELYSSAQQSSATLIARVLYPLNFGDPGYCTPSTSACGGPWQTLAYTSSATNIVSIRFSSQASQLGPSVYADFDNLVFNAGESAQGGLAEASFASDFNSGLPAGMSLFGQARVEAGYLKLQPLAGDSHGIAYLNDFNGGQPVVAFKASFKASLFGSTCCGGGAFPADGFSFNLVPASSALPSPGYNEPGEEGLSQGLAVNFDTWDNGGGEAPAIEVKWLGAVVAFQPFQASQSPAGITDAAAAARLVDIRLDSDGTIDVSYGGTLVISNAPTGYRASVIGAPKWIWGARAGTANDQTWLDDLRLEVAAGPQRCLDFDAGVPSGLRLFGDARLSEGYLKLVTVPSESFGIAYLEDFGGGRLVEGFRAAFKAALFGSTCCGSGQFPADGFSFNLVPAATLNSNPGYGQPAEEGLDEGLAVNFDTWDNGDGEGPAIEVKWLGQLVARAPFQPSQSPAGITDPAAAQRAVVIQLRTDGRIDVSYGGTVVFSNLQTPYHPSAIGTPAWVLGARVGGANDNHWIEDLCITMQTSNRRMIPRLFSTGVDGSGNSLADDLEDPHFRRLPPGPSIQPSFPAYVATSAGGFPIPPWLPDGRRSAWIAPTVSTVANGPGDFIYETRFDLTGFDPATARIRGRWAADNRGDAIVLNGVPVTGATVQTFDAWQTLDISNGFVAGTNVLWFIVHNDVDLGSPDGSNPSGLRAELWGAASLACGAPRSAVQLFITQNHPASLEVGWSQPGFVLQGALTVTGPWADLTRGVTANGQNFSATVAKDSPTRFLRLRLDCE